jgi:A/G-specific adenine glycosylase
MWRGGDQQNVIFCGSPGPELPIRATLGAMMPPAPRAADLLEWYDGNRRRMPWRALPGETPDPYRVWLSEIMLQQTTVAAVVPYFERFLARFPTVQALAAAPEDAVMSGWAGLGYYARARNLHACARAVAAAGGRFPSDIAGLQALPGIGPYTARAVAAIAYGVPCVPVDGNVERVVSRIFAIEAPLPGAKPALAAAADRLGDQRAAQARASDFAQALFDLGATLCTGTPACALCPWQTACAAHRSGIAATLPRRAPKGVRPIRHGAQFWLTDPGGQVLLRRRKPQGLLGGMTELPGTDWRPDIWQAEEAVRHAPMPAAWRRLGAVRHIFTHFELRLDVYAAQVGRIEAEGFLRPAAALADEALPSVMRKCVAVARAAV